MMCKSNILPLTVGYLNGTINRKTRTQNWRLEPTGRAIPTTTGALTGMCSVLARQDAVAWVFGRFWNQTELLSWSKHWPLAGYPDMLLTLFSRHECSGWSRWCRCPCDSWYKARHQRRCGSLVFVGQYIYGIMWWGVYYRWAYVWTYGPCWGCGQQWSSLLVHILFRLYSVGGIRCGIFVHCPLCLWGGVTRGYVRMSSWWIRVRAVGEAGSIYIWLRHRAWMGAAGVILIQILWGWNLCRLWRGWSSLFPCQKSKTEGVSFGRWTKLRASWGLKLGTCLCIWTTWRLGRKLGISLGLKDAWGNYLILRLLSQCS